MKGLHQRLAESHAHLARGRVWCRHCAASRSVDPALCLQHGWPRHCGYTMTIDSPDERFELARRDRTRCLEGAV